MLRMGGGRLAARLAAAIVVLAGAGAGDARAQDLADYDYENLAFRGIGFDVGRIWPSNLDPTTTFRLRIDLGYLGPGIRIVPSIGYWKTNVEASELDAFERQLEDIGGGSNIDLGEVELSDLSFQLDAHFVWTTPIDLLVFIGAGAGLHTLNGQGRAIDDTFIEDLFDSIMPGLTALGGLEYAVVDRFRVYTEGHLSVVSDILNPGVTIGGAIMLPGRLRGED